MQDKHRHGELNENSSEGDETARFLVSPAGNQNSERGKQRYCNNKHREMFYYTQHLILFILLFPYILFLLNDMMTLK